MVFYLIATPYAQNQNEQQTINSIQQNGCSGNASLDKVEFANEITKFKLGGNLDSQMYINEVMIKLDTTLETTLKKIERQYLDLSEQQVADFIVETKDGQKKCDQYIKQFKWDDSKFSRSNPLIEIVKTLQTRMNQIDNDLREKNQQYQESKNMQTQLAKKEGNLAVRDLGDLLKGDVIKGHSLERQSNFLTTVCVVVPKSNIEEFKNKYQEICEYVVPGTAKQFNIPEEKDGLTLWSVILFKQDLYKQQNEDQPPKQQEEEKEIKVQKKVAAKKSPLEEFAIKAREILKVSVREFNYDPKSQEEKEKQRNIYENAAKTNFGLLKQFLKKAFSELYQIYIHLKFLRFTVDISMRYGIGEKAVYILIQPNEGKEKKVQTNMIKLFCDPKDMGLYGTKEELEEQEDFFPFVYVPISILI